MALTNTLNHCALVNGAIRLNHLTNTGHVTRQPFTFVNEAVFGFNTANALALPIGNLTRI
jgi:hypothetical protein